jgi:hypothetical protein
LPGTRPTIRLCAGQILFVIEEDAVKKNNSILAVLLGLIMILTVAGCGKTDQDSLVGTWEYSNQENGIGAVYVLENDGTGTYTMKVAEQEVTYELKYEVDDNHLLVTYVNNETFTEDDVFDNEFKLKDSRTLIIRDSTDEELTFVKK